jgi:hypothetical protein
MVKDASQVMNLVPVSSVIHRKGTFDDVRAGIPLQSFKLICNIAGRQTFYTFWEVITDVSESLHFCITFRLMDHLMTTR